MAQTQDLTDAQIAQMQPGLGGEEPPPGLIAGRRALDSPEIRAQIFRPSDRPQEPVTTGMPFGPGANVIDQHRVSDSRRRAQVAQQLEASPTASAAVKRFAERLRRGQ